VRILWVSDRPTSPSGFGAVTAAVCRRLAARGHHVEILGWQNRGFDTRWEGIPVHPVRRDLFGSDVLLGYLYRMRPHFFITLADTILHEAAHAAGAPADQLAEIALEAIHNAGYPRR
jgi:nucleoside-diphosphate-sugar epimerase